MSALDGLGRPRTRVPDVRRLRRDVEGSLSALSFWFAIVLPAGYLPLLVAGIESTQGLLAFFCLFGLHLLALVGGRAYGSRDSA